MDAATLQWFSTLGVGGALAGLMFMFYRKDVRSFTDLWKAQSEQLITVVKENTAAITANTTTIQALHRRNDEIERTLQRLGIEVASHRRHDRAEE